MDNRIIDLSQEGNNLFDKFQRFDTEKSVLLMEAKYYNYLNEYLDSKKGDHEVIIPNSVGVRDQLLTNKYYN